MRKASPMQRRCLHNEEPTTDRRILGLHPDARAASLAIREYNQPADESCRPLTRRPSDERRKPNPRLVRNPIRRGLGVGNREGRET